MATKRKKKGAAVGGRAATVALSLCLLAVITMIGMYTVGRSDQKTQELEEQVAEAQEQAKAQEKALEEERQQELEEQQRAEASAAAQRQQEQLKTETKTVNEAELESDFVMEESEIADNRETSQLQPAASSDAVKEQPALSFSADSDTVLWPVAGNIILDYSMDKSVYFSTLDQYKYNPAVIIQGSLGENVVCGAQGKVTSVKTLEETGTTVTLDIGDGYELIYGQLKELTVKEGDLVDAGETIGYVSEPTKYYTREGCNVYFEVRKDGKSIDPMTLLQ